jgi:hypothetical protein
MPDDKTAVDIFVEAGRLLYDSDDWPTRYAAALGIRATRVRDIRRGKADLGREDALLYDALKLAERRAEESIRARDAITAWLAQHRKRDGET